VGFFVSGMMGNFITMILFQYSNPQTIESFRRIFLYSLFSLIAINLHAREIAITFDDAPLPGSNLMDGKEKTTAILNALQKHKVPNATFFLTMQNISSKDDLARLKQYDDAGYKLAHHSFSHMSASKNKFEQYKNDFIKADKMLSSLGLNNIIKQHRFPFLHHGDTYEKRAQIKNLLNENGYTIGYVTIDNFDWYINSKVVKAFKSGMQINFDNLKKLYIDALWHSITFYDDLAKDYLKRSPKHVLLLHENELAALFLGDLLEHIKSKGWKIISPEAAYKDSIANISKDLNFNKQGRIAAIAHSKGADKKELRSKTENISHLDELFTTYEVIKNDEKSD